MNRTLAILRKDVRHLWPHIMAYAVLLALGALLDPTYTSHGAGYYVTALWDLVLPVACCNLVIAAIHEEKLTGDCQYWLTRPYGWQRLLAAKALFLAVFVNGTLLLQNLAVFAAAGVPPLDHVSTILWRQAFFTVFFVLAPAALAAVTRNLGQAVLGALGVVVLTSALAVFNRVMFSAIPVPGTLSASAASAWSVAVERAAAVALGGSLILLLQYSRRHTGYSRALFAFTTLAAVFGIGSLPWSRGTAKPQTADAETVRIALDPRPRQPEENRPRTTRLVSLNIPVRVDFPRAVALYPARLRASIRGSRFRLSMEGDLVVDESGRGWQKFTITDYAYRYLKDATLDFYGSAEVMLAVPGPRFPLPRNGRLVVPGVGSCFTGRDDLGKIAFQCYSPFPRTAVFAASPETVVALAANWIVTPGYVKARFPMPGGFQPLERFSSILSYRNWDEVNASVSELATLQPIARVECRFDFKGIRLADYATQ